MSGVNIKIRADARQAQNEISKINKSMGNLDQQARKATDTFRRLAIGITAAFGASAFTKGITRAADSMTMLENRTRLVTKTASQTTATLNELFNVAARSGSDVEAVAETFNRFGLALKDSKKPVKELLLVTEAVQQAAAISGSGAQSAKAAIIQLGQGLASGQLRGQELNSVLEQMPRLAQAIADGMGIPFGKLREEAMAGKVTAEAVYSAILKGAKDIDGEFQTLEFTTGQFAVVFANELKRAVAVFDDVTGFSDDIKTGLQIGANAARFFAQNFKRYIGLAGLELMILKSDLRFFAADFKSFFADLFSGDFDAKGFVDNVTESINKARASIKEKFTVVLNFTTEKVDLIKDKFPGIDAALKALGNFRDAVVRIFDEIVDRVLRRSPWTGLFDPNHEEPGAPAIGNTKFMWKWLNKALNALSAFKNSVIERFSAINAGVTKRWSELKNSIETKGITVTISEQTGNVWTSIRTSYDELIQYLSTKEIETPGGLQTVETNFGLAIRRIKEQYNSLSNSIFKDEVFVEGLGQNGGEFVQVDAAWIQSFRSGLDKAQGYFDSFVELLKNTPLVIGITVLTESIRENFGEVSDKIRDYFILNGDQLAAAVSGALFLFLDKRFRGLVFGPALATAILAAAGTLGQNQEFLDAANKVAKGFGKAIKDVFSGDGDVVADILDGLKNLASTVADGFLEGLFGPEFENEVVSNLTTALVIATGAFIIVPGLITNLGKIALKISSVMFGARWAGYLADGFVIGITEAADFAKKRKKLASAITDFGFHIGQGIRKGAVGLIGGAILGYQINEIFDVDQTSATGLGVTIATSIGTGMLSYALYDTVADLVKRVGKAAVLRAAAFSVGGIISGSIAAGIAAAPFAIIAAVAAAIGLAVVKGVTYFNDREMSKNASINLSLGISTALDRKSLGRANAKLEAPLNTFIEDISKIAKENIDKGLVGADLIDATFADDIVDEFEEKLNKSLKKNNTFKDPAKLTEGLRLNFPGFKFDEDEVRRMAEEGRLDLSELLRKGTLFKTPLEIAPDIVLAAESKVDLETIRNSLLDAGAANAGDILAETLTKISESPIITPEQLTSLDQGSTAIEKLASAFERLGRVVKDATGFSFSFNNTKSVMDNYSTSAFSSGGRVSGAGTGTSDDIPAMLSNGEFVMRQAAVQKFGPSFMEAVNAGKMPKGLSVGGSVRDRIKERVTGIRPSGDLIENIVGYFNSKQDVRDIKFGEFIKNASGYEDPKRLVGYLGGMASGNNSSENDSILTNYLNASSASGRISNLFTGKADKGVYDVISAAALSGLRSLATGLSLSVIPGIGTVMGLLSTLPDLVLQPLQGVVKYFRQTTSFGGNGVGGSILDFFTEQKTLGDIKSLVKEPFYNLFNKLPGFNTGGKVTGSGTSTSDDIPAMLSNGEYVMQASAVRKFGPGFMASINAGIAPIFRTIGGDTKSAASILGIETESSTSATIRRALAQIRQAEGRGDAIGAEEAENLKQALQDLYDITADQVAILEEGGEGAKGVVEDAEAKKKREEAVKTFTEDFKNEIASGLSYALQTGDFKGALAGILDSFTSQIIDNFSSNLVESFTSSFDFSAIFDSFGGGGMGGGFGGGVGSLLKTGLGFLGIPGFSQGGVVPSTPFSQAGKDSVPILAMPGEVVLSKNDVRNMESNKNANTQSFNINVQGDVSRQTRKEIVKMIPQITGGVNAQNKESNYRR